MPDINIFIAAGAGLLSFISPCTLPLYPAFLSYVTGVSVGDLKDKKGIHSLQAMLQTLFFIIGFSIIFIALGLSTTFIGQFFSMYRGIIRQIGAILIVFFGLVVVGLIQPQFMMVEKRVSFKRRPSGYIGTVLIGMGFAAGWTPCTGPILASVIALGVSNPESALFYTLAYTVGFALPFFILAFFIDKLTWMKKQSQVIVKLGGILMIFMGVLLYFDWMTKLIGLLIRIYGGFTGF